jgi:gluconolactonase
MTGRAIYRVSADGAVATISTGTVERPASVPNYPAFLPSGQLAYTDSGDWGSDNGCIYVVSLGGETVVADVSAGRFPNGLAVSPDGSGLAVVESLLPGVSVLAIGEDGSLHDRRVAVEMPGTIPDGVAYDEEGGLLVSCWAPDAVFLVEPGRDPMPLVYDERRFMLNQPTNIAFVPGTSTVIAANIGERFLSVFEHDKEGAAMPRPHFPYEPER